ncbi:fimbrillin family protein [Odoribacter sp. OttesenSCG-928-J03]|nr:fimbrillin family protein [Odoribacter sp. OttesenSCG-928-J03]MDL2330614.1 fimbrillin family protein [Odoribacter sp. OttesenSCG-928-A06]
MKIRIKLLLLAFVMTLVSCQKEDKESEQAPSELVSLFASIGSPKIESRHGQTDPVNGSVVAFAEADELGLFATISLCQNDGIQSPVNNLRFELKNGKWGDGIDNTIPLLKWDVNAIDEDNKALSADIYAYAPYQSDLSDGYNLFKTVNGDSHKGKLHDVLFAERTTVENNNPAIFLTFKHRFALINMSLGSGMGMVTAADPVSIVMSEGIDRNADLQKEGIHQIVEIKYRPGEITEFEHIKKIAGGAVFIIPAGNGSSGDPLQFIGVRIAGTLYSLDVPIVADPNALYNITIHKGVNGTVTLEIGQIEDWAARDDLAGIREKGGLYWASDLINLINEYNRILAKEGTYPPKESPKLKEYGEWVGDEVNGHWEFRLYRNLDMNDIDRRGALFNDFQGSFNGFGFTIKGLDITGSGENTGLFGKISGGSEIKDLKIDNISVKGNGANTGALAGQVAAGVKISNCHITGISVVEGNGLTGGLIGQGAADILRCSSSAEVKNGTADHAGGLVGKLDAPGSISSSKATGTIYSEGALVGGLVGEASGTLKECITSCDVTGSNHVGGLVGKTIAEVLNCNSMGEINGIENVGGLIGETSSEVTSSTSNGTVSGQSNVGGLIGQHSVAAGEIAVINGCSSRSEISASGGNTGGLIGKGVTYVPEWMDDSDPEHPITILASGTVVRYSYSTNKKQMIGSDDGYITCSYNVGTTSESDDTNCLYQIEIPLSSADADELLSKLNSGGSASWVMGTVIIDGVGYKLPILFKL